MSLSEQQNLLAKLYTDAEFRRAFLTAPEKIGAENDLSETETAEIAAIMPEELEFFADSLFWKRLREAEKFLPLTKKVLGEDFKEHFRAFSQIYNPQTVKKHFEDAVEFCGYLQKNLHANDPAKDAAKFERAKLYFYSGLKNAVVVKLNRDFRKIHDAQTTPKDEPDKKKTFAIWFRIGKMEKHFIF